MITQIKTKCSFFVWVFVLLLCKSLCVIAQKDTSITGIKDGIGLTFSPLYSKQTIGFKGGFAFSGGISGLFVMDKKRNIFLSAEAGYLNNGGISTANLVSIKQNNNYLPTTYVSKVPFNLTNRDNCIYVSATIEKIIFKLPKGLYLLAGLGIQMNYLYSYKFSTKGFIDDNTGKNTEYTWQHSMSYTSASLVIKASLIKQMGKRFSVMVSPVFHYGIKANFVYDVGANFQLLYSLH